MRNRSPLLTFAIAIPLGVLVLAFAAWPRVPRLVRDLQSRPEAGRVVFQGERDAALTVVHLRDWHALFGEEAEWNDQVVREAKEVQSELRGLLRFLFEREQTDVVKEMYSGRLSEKSMMRFVKDRELAIDLKPKGKQPNDPIQQELSAYGRRYGVIGQMYVQDEVQIVMPLTTNVPLDHVVLRDGKDFRGPLDDVENRRREIMDWLPKKGVAIIVLSGSHNLAAYLPPGTLYIQVTPRSYPGAVFSLGK